MFSYGTCHFVFIKAWIILFYPIYSLVQFVVLYRGLGILPCMWHAVRLNLTHLAGFMVLWFDWGFNASATARVISRR